MVATQILGVLKPSGFPFFVWVVYLSVFLSFCPSPICTLSRFRRERGGSGKPLTRGELGAEGEGSYFKKNPIFQIPVDSQCVHTMLCLMDLREQAATWYIVVAYSHAHSLAISNSCYVSNTLCAPPKLLKPIQGLQTDLAPVPALYVMFFLDLFDSLLMGLGQDQQQNPALITGGVSRGRVRNYDTRKISECI